MKKIMLLVAIMIAFLTSMAQTEYERQAQNSEYKRLQEATQRAYNVPRTPPPTSTYKSPSSTSSSSSSSGSSSSNRSTGGSILPASGNANIGGSDRVNRQNAAGERNEKRAADRKIIIDRDIAKFQALLNASTIPKDAAHYDDLWQLGYGNNIDQAAIRILIGSSEEDYREKLKTIIQPSQREINAAVKLANETEKKRVAGNLRSYYEENFLRAGFSAYESKMITLNYLIGYDGNPTSSGADAEAIAALLKSLNENLNTISFIDFKTKIERLNTYGPYTALTLVNKMMGKFADKTAELEELQKNSIVSYFNIATSHNDHENSDKLIDVFFTLLKKYPALDVYVLTNCKYNDPFQAKLINLKYFGAKSKQFDKVHNLWADAKNKLANQFNTICQTSAGIEAAMRTEPSLSLSHFISQSYRSEFGGTQDAVDFGKHINNRLYNSDNYYDVYMMHGNRINTYLRCSPQVLKELAAHGNFEAQYLYSLHLCNSNDDLLRKQHSKILLESAEKGNSDALALLCYSPLWETLYKDKVIRDRKANMPANQFTDSLVLNYNNFNTMFAYLKAEISKSKIPSDKLKDIGISLQRNMPTSLYIFTKYKDYAETLEGNDQMSKNTIKCRTLSKDDYLVYASKNPYNTTISDMENLHIAHLIYYYCKNQQTFPDAEYTTAIKSYNLFNKEKAKASFKILSKYALDAQLLPTAATTCMKELYRLFPKEQAYLERQELLMMKYYFGGQVKNIFTYSFAYPRSMYEIMGAERDDTLLLRLAYLAEKYPVETKQMTAESRIIVNPLYYTFYHAMNGVLKDQPNSFRIFLGKSGLYTPFDMLDYSTQSAADIEYALIYKLRWAAEALLQFDPNFVASLSTDEWKNIARIQNLSLDRIAWCFRDEKNESKYKTRFANLSAAMQN